MSIGTVWDFDTWDSDSWGDDTWDNVSDPTISFGTGSLSAGSSYTMAADTPYKLPIKLIRIAVLTVLGTIEISNDGITWTPAVLDTNNEFNTGAKYIQVIDDIAIISIKELRRR